MTTVLDKFRLDGKIALVTGGATGLGAAMATALAEACATVACHGSRRPVDDTANAVVVAGGRAAAFSADLSDRAGAETLFAEAVVFLASVAGDYVHGQVLVVDGGWTAR